MTLLQLLNDLHEAPRLLSIVGQNLRHGGLRRRVVYGVPILSKLYLSKIKPQARMM